MRGRENKRIPYFNRMTKQLQAPPHDEVEASLNMQNVKNGDKPM